MKSALVYGAIVTLGVFVGGGCFDAAGDCERNPNLQCGPWAPQNTGGSSSSSVSSAGGGGGGGGGGQSGSGGSGGGGGGPVDDCVPVDGKAVGATCGVFVSPGGDDAVGDGSQDKPYKTLQKGIDAGKDSIYLCNDTAGVVVSESGSAMIVANLTIYGGFACDGWTYGGTVRSAVVGNKNVPGIKISGSGTVATIRNIALSVPSADEAGASALGIVVDGSKLDLVDSVVAVGKGFEGLAGDTPTPPTDAPINTGAGVGACTDGVNTSSGGTSTANSVCPEGTGGRGGDSTPTDGDSGQDGKPNSSAVGLGGLGETDPKAPAIWSCIQGNGGLGNPGNPGNPGAGAAGQGKLSPLGWIGVEGGDGGPGAIGQGGGGGGAAKGTTAVSGLGACSGASGGAGGAGGCGGGGGKGGQPGGASIGIISYTAAVHIQNCTITTEGGGDGGRGGNGQQGANGSDGAKGGAGGTGLYAGLKAGCKGGDGGPGGTGGPGGGGLGGGSLGIAFVGDPVVVDAATIITPGPAGVGGLPGAGGTTGQSGEAGPMAPILELAAQ